MKKNFQKIITFFAVGIILSISIALLSLNSFIKGQNLNLAADTENSFYLTTVSGPSSKNIRIEEKNIQDYLKYLTVFDYSTEINQISDKKYYIASNFSKPFQIEVIPNSIDVNLLESRIREILADESDNYGVYIYDFKRNLELGINQDKIFPPMSISKLPVAVMALREIDKGNLSLDQQSEFTWQDWADPTNVLGAKYIGTSFAIRDYLRFLIVDSDNSSIRKLENLMGGNLEVNEKVKSELGVNYFFRQPHDTTAKDVGIVYRGIYTESYLSTELNSFLVDLLLNTHWALQDGIPVGLPYGTKIAHKTGQGSSDPGYIWADSGIIFGEKTDYALVILNEKIDIPVARWKVQQISKVVYDTLN